MAFAASCGTSSTVPSGTFTLTIANFASWCAIAVTQPAGTALPNGASGATNVLSLPANTVVRLHGEPASSTFIWAPSAGKGGWSGGIDSNQNPLSKDTQVTLSASKAINVCCPFADGTGCT
jgi:hypothetical protein